MTDEPERTFIAGNPNPKRFGWSLRACNSHELDVAQIAKASTLLGRDAFFVDDSGYECEIIAATVHPDEKRIVYVESRAKEIGDFVDIAIKIHYVDSNGLDQSVDIESYNPFFGCDVALIEWFDEQIAILIYREKHWTFVYRIGDVWPPENAKIEDRWQISGDALSYMAYKAETVRRLAIPTLTPMSTISVEDAETLRQMPPDPY